MKLNVLIFFSAVGRVGAPKLTPQVTVAQPATLSDRQQAGQKRQSDQKDERAGER